LSSLANRPLATCPSAITQAPVSVAMSTTASGLKRSEYVSASQRISRPSASVFRISTVWPDIVVTTSPGREALPPGMFSQVATTPTTLTGAFMPASARSAPSTLPAPDMSNFISSISGAGLSEMPPVSNVMPLPTNTSGARPFGPPE
jgi:hypothetical protein